MKYALDLRNEWIGRVVESRVTYKTVPQSHAFGLPLADDNHLFFDYAPRQLWVFHGALYVECANEGTDIAYGFTGTTPVTGHFAGFGLHSTAANNLLMGCGVRVNVGSFAVFGIINDFITVNQFHGIVESLDNSGRLKLQWSQNTSNAAPSRVCTLSYLVAERIG